MNFNTKQAPIRDVLCRHFYEGFRSLIRLWIDEKDYKLDSWDALIKKTTSAKAKVKIQAVANCNFNQQCYQSNQAMYTTTAKAQSTKNSKTEEPRAQGLEKPSLQHFNKLKSFNKA